MMYKSIMEFKVRELDIFYRMSGWLKKSDVVSSKSALPPPFFWSLSDSVMLCMQSLWHISLVEIAWISTEDSSVNHIQFIVLFYMHLIFSLEKKQKIILIKCSIYVISKKKKGAMYIALAIIVWGCFYPFLFDNTYTRGRKACTYILFYVCCHIIIYFSIWNLGQCINNDCD